MATLQPTPRRALVELDERQRRMFARADGLTLDLSEYSSFRLPALIDGGERYDTIVSVLQISVAPDAAAYCRQLAQLLDERGRLLFLEPTAVVGAVGAVQHALGPLVRRATGRRPDYDIPALLRGAGLAISDCERISMRSLWPYRSFVEGVAHLPYKQVDE